MGGQGVAAGDGKVSVVVVVVVLVISCSVLENNAQNFDGDK